MRRAAAEGRGAKFSPIGRAAVPAMSFSSQVAWITPNPPALILRQQALVMQILAPE